MISYEYECEHCGYTLEVEQSIKDKPKRRCPECGKYKLERLISGGLDGFMRREPTTIGQIGDINWKRDRSKIMEQRAAAKEAQPTPKKTWYESPDKDKKKKINRMNSDQKFKYIMEGD